MGWCAVLSVANVPLACAKVTLRVVVVTLVECGQAVYLFADPVVCFGACADGKGIQRGVGADTRM